MAKEPEPIISGSAIYLPRCPICSGRGYLRCACWPGDCICGYGDETCEECDGSGDQFDEYPDYDDGCDEY